ncbi:thiamine pyrophosphate-dependent dehydrogenase E1 component subunit alpha [Mesorhizobium sp. B3-1-7]|uniref:thiamine pyrophosphate-dependent dehydrogenase E1 component subunit alpha n=1 Tax=Mesorhizobium sp. B3-1-7 TaxID=2589894 RepID=UPI00112B8A95|nr:thiamine pyrophosphate-dependent dehydrogenase E1 component subunit alpha [Mesorhizobium sp. B3-1-7]TPI59071.1 thiamine pyrophosphate-dependent dehydrogenase E1 component subunit alpha [Mesorhizobium sp. B3-1-7]
MTLSNSNSPLARREALDDRLEQLRRMIEIRFVEERIQKLFAEGHVRGSTHLASGQEGVSVGIARSIDPDDIVTCTYRGHGHALALGLTPAGVIGEICGRVIGCAGGVGGSMHLVEPAIGLLPTAAIIGAGLPIACGAALAARARGTDRVAVAIFGDGSANIGAFHESLNFAAIQKLPVVFVCENNLYGEYTRIQLSTPVEDIAIRAASYNMPGVIVDGQDADKVAEAMATAVARARRGEGPSLVEMKTYRYSGHSRSDPATYRPAGELDAWLKRDPIDIFAERLTAEKLLAARGLDSLKTEVREAVETATAEVLDSPAPELGEIMAHVGAYSAGGDQRHLFWSN